VKLQEAQKKLDALKLLSPEARAVQEEKMADLIREFPDLMEEE
jgi:hypothetical protein